MNLVPNEVTANINNSKPQQSLHSANNVLRGRADHQPYLFTRYKLSSCYIGIIGLPLALPFQIRVVVAVELCNAMPWFSLLHITNVHLQHMYISFPFLKLIVL